MSKNNSDLGVGWADQLAALGPVVDRLLKIWRPEGATPAERQDPKLLNGSRRARIAKGSGTAVQEVNSLMERFTQAQIMMKQMGKGGMPVMPGMPGFGMGGGKKSKGKMPKQQKMAKGAQGRSGNPAKRIVGNQPQGAAQELAPPNLGSLPPDLKKMLGQ